MEYRQWEHEPQDPRDPTSRPAWSADDDDERGSGGYELPRRSGDLPRRSRHGRWDSGQEWADPPDPPDPPDPVDPVDPPAQWSPAGDTQAWPADTGWHSGRHELPAEGYQIDPGYPSSYPSGYGSGYPSGYPTGYPVPEHPAPAWPGDAARERDDWYGRPPDPPPPSTRRPADLVPAPRRARAYRVERREDEEAEPRGGYLPAVFAAAIWYGAAVALYVVWALTRGDTPEPNCLDPAGDPCPAPRTGALNSLVDATPPLATAVGLSLVLALIVRWSIPTWRSATVGFVASVVGAGIATLVFSLVAPR